LGSFKISKEIKKQRDRWMTTKRSIKEGQLIQKTTMISRIIALP
jgi:hypothetical protein